MHIPQSPGPGPLYTVVGEKAVDLVNGLGGKVVTGCALALSLGPSVLMSPGPKQIGLGPRTVAADCPSLETAVPGGGPWEAGRKFTLWAEGEVKQLCSLTVSQPSYRAYCSWGGLCS